MMCCRMMFCKIVGFVETAFSPKDMKLTLADAVTDPIKSHVDGFRAFLLNGVVGNSRCCAVVVVIGVAGCEWPSSASVMRKGHASFPLWKKAPSSASAALDKTSRIIWQ